MKKQQKIHGVTYEARKELGQLDWYDRASHFPILYHVVRGLGFAFGFFLFLFLLIFALVMMLFSKLGGHR